MSFINFDVPLSVCRRRPPEVVVVVPHVSVLELGAGPDLGVDAGVEVDQAEQRDEALHRHIVPVGAESELRSEKILTLIEW